MKEKPILFTKAMVDAILAGRKTETRRIMADQPPEGYHLLAPPRLTSQKRATFCKQAGDRKALWLSDNCPYAGCEQLWVREEHHLQGHWEAIQGDTTPMGKQKWQFVQDGSSVLYVPPAASYRKSRDRDNPHQTQSYKRLGRFMPRKHCRLVLPVRRIWAEQLQDIDEQGAIAEGVIATRTRGGPPDTSSGDNTDYRSAVCNYRLLWEQIHGKQSWDTNPWVWVIRFDEEQVL